MIYKIKLKTKQHELKKNTGVTSGVSEGFLDPCPIIAPVVLLLNQGRTQDFKLGVFCVKNHDFTPKNHIFPILGGAHESFGVFHVKNHDFTPKKSYFFQF
jgi:hypothetical protein